MAAEDLEKAFLEAAAIAKKLPKNLQEAGFNRAVEQLLGSGASTKRKTDINRNDTTHGEADVTQLIDAIDRTAHPDIGATARVADRALKVLQLVHQHHGVDGLTAGEIATILSRKFRLPTKPNSVMKALERETDTVDVRSGAGASRVFHIMAPGEVYLKTLRSGENSGRRSTAGGARRTRKGTTKKKASTKKTAKKEASTKKTAKKEASTKKTAKKKATAKKTRGRPGPKAAITQLLEADFFRSARTISEVQDELRHRRGHAYSVQELSPALVRSVRDQSMIRGRNDDGQYEYSEA